MTGDLNLDGHNINNVAALNATGNITTTGDLQARNIKATGKIDADGNISAGNWVWAKNGYGDAIGFGGDAGGGDYEIRLYNGTKPLTIYSLNAADYTTVLNVYKNTKIQQRLATNGLNPNEMPPGFSAGGVRTVDVVATGSFYSILAGTTISEGKFGFYARQDGNVKASGNIESSQNVKGATLESTGRTTVGEFIQLNGQATVGATCSPNGLQGRTAEGKILSCVNGVWTGSVQINNSQCKWFSPANAFSSFGKASEQLHEKPIICPAGYIMTGSKMWGWAEGVDDEHVDIYCCPLS